MTRSSLEKKKNRRPQTQDPRSAKCGLLNCTDIPQQHKVNRPSALQSVHRNPPHPTWHHRLTATELYSRCSGGSLEYADLAVDNYHFSNTAILRIVIANWKRKKKSKPWKAQTMFLLMRES